MLMVEKRTKKKKEKTDHQIIVEILGKLVKPEILKTNYPKEYKMFKKLMEKYPDTRIWSNIKFQVNSLAFYFTPKGINEIERVVNSINYVVKDNEVVELAKEKIGEDLHIEKPMSLKDFLKKYK